MARLAVWQSFGAHGVDGHPAPELRGLHAWLAVHLPEYADELIDADPYGVLTYGDAASLGRSSCRRMVQALGRLSETDPWFRSGNWQAPSIGALARADMTEEFKVVLRSPQSGFAVRSIVVEALALGTPLPAMKDDLADVWSGGNRRLQSVCMLCRLCFGWARTVKPQSLLPMEGLGRTTRGSGFARRSLGNCTVGRLVRRQLFSF